MKVRVHPHINCSSTNKVNKIESTSKDLLTSKGSTGKKRMMDNTFYLHTSWNNNHI